jgi:hypothetical protein
LSILVVLFLDLYFSIYFGANVTTNTAIYFVPPLFSSLDSFSTPIFFREKDYSTPLIGKQKLVLFPIFRKNSWEAAVNALMNWD